MSEVIIFKISEIFALDALSFLDVSRKHGNNRVLIGRKELGDQKGTASSYGAGISPGLS